jgi:outer membrane immunogenic protein
MNARLFKKAGVSFFHRHEVLRYMQKHMLMKTRIFTIAILISVATVASAQVRVGPYLGYGEELNRWGIGALAEVMLSERVAVSPNFTVYFPKNFDNNPRRSGWELNANMNYYVVNGDVGYLYGLAGLNYTTVRTRTSTPTADVVDNDGNLGFNFGIGTMVGVNDFFYPFAEAKYTAGGYSQISLFFGIKFQLGGGSLDYDY